MSTRTKALSVTLAGDSHLAIGLMSGTSHDGISAAIVEIRNSSDPPVRLLAFRTYRYDDKFRSRLLEASSAREVGAAEISALNAELGRALGRTAIAIAREARIPIDRISFIGSHGHTLYHLPPRRAARGETPSTLQLGESAVIAAMTCLPVVADFRPMDLALGGEAAPLAPLAHVMIFGHRKLGRAVLNIGGIANLTVIPATAKLDSGRVIAFDTGPGVMLIDGLASKLSGGRMKMDRDGRMSARGKVHARLLSELMRHPYFRRRPPKSTGREEFGADYLEQIQKRARELGLGAEDLIATLTALTARSIGGACRQCAKLSGRIDQLIATGGGSRNPVLMQMLRDDLRDVEVLSAEQLGVNAEAIEAMAFAILAWRMIRSKPGNIPSVTGARSPAILGKLTLPPGALV